MNIAKLPGLLEVINKKDNTEYDHHRSNGERGRPAAILLAILTGEPLFFRVAAHKVFQLTWFAVILVADTVSHAARVKFGVFARSKNFDPGCFDALRVNDDRPLPSLNPRADCVSYSPVLHQIELRAKLTATQAH